MGNVRPIVETFIKQVAADLTEIEVEIKDEKKIKFIDLQELTIKTFCQ